MDRIIQKLNIKKNVYFSFNKIQRSREKINDLVFNEALDNFLEDSDDEIMDKKLEDLVQLSIRKETQKEAKQSICDFVQSNSKTKFNFNEIFIYFKFKINLKLFFLYF